MSHTSQYTGNAHIISSNVAKNSYMSFYNHFCLSALVFVIKLNLFLLKFALINAIEKRIVTHFLKA